MRRCAYGLCSAFCFCQNLLAYLYGWFIFSSMHMQRSFQTFLSVVYVCGTSHMHRLLGKQVYVPMFCRALSGPEACSTSAHAWAGWELPARQEMWKWCFVAQKICKSEVGRRQDDTTWPLGWRSTLKRPCWKMYCYKRKLYHDPKWSRWQTLGGMEAEQCNLCFRASEICCILLPFLNSHY